MIIGAEGATPAQEAEATKIVFMLWEAYPGHPWYVRVYDGGFFIRHLDSLESPKPYGMNVKFKTFCHDAAVMKKEIIRNAGEWLERAGIRRGRHEEGQTVTHVEGVPMVDQNKLKDVKIVMADGTPARTAPMPQVQV